MDSSDAAKIIVMDKVLDTWRDSQSYKRVKAFEALDGERQYQESLHKKTGQDPISIPGELALLKVYLEKAFITYAETFGDPGEKPTMDVIRKITAIGLRAIENYGCPLRDIEGSLAARPPEHRAKDMADRSADVPTTPADKKGEFLQRAWDNDLAEKCAYPELRKNAGCQACNIGGCEFDLRPNVKEPGAPDLHEIDGADQD